MKKTLHQLVQTLLAAWLLSCPARVLAVSFSAGSATIAPGATTTIPVTVSGFSQVLNFQYTVTWDASVLEYVSSGSSGLSGVNTSLFSSSKLTVSWDDTAGQGVSVSDGTTAFTIQFRAVGANGSSSSVGFSDSPTPKEALVKVGTSLVTQTPGTSAGTVNVSKPKPTITWSNPAAITYGTALSGTQLNATASVAGQFSYTPSSGTVLNAGSQTLNVTFTPNDTAAYDNATASVTITVNKATPTLTWSNPSDISYGTALSGTQLNATTGVSGTYSYSPASGTTLSVGNGQMLSVTFTPTDTANYNTATASVTINVTKGTPTISWSTPSAISYGTALTSSAQLNATASVPGTFVYSPAAGTVLNAGNQTLTVGFTPTDTANYNSASANVTLTVNKATPSISWSNPAAVTFGATLSGTQLNATASVQGTFSYSPSLGTLPNAGNNQTLSVTFTPNDTANYNTATASVTINVNKATPSINWSNPSDMTYGTALSSTQLNATANVQGTFAYSPSAGTVLNVGNSQTLSVTFTPADTANYNTATASVTINVQKVSVQLSWSNPSAITYGTALSGTQLNATANIPGSFAYSPASGTVLNAGSQTLSVTFTPTDTANYSTATANVTITVNKATPSINWSNPADITYGTALSGTQLNASSGVAGSFAYSPASGTVLNAGNNQTLSVGFTPTDTANYNTATANVSINVARATPTITWSNPSAITYGTALGGAQLNATASVQGAFAYSPAAGAVPGAGSQTLSVTFTPNDTANYNTATASVTINVNKATPTISWSNPADISYGTALGGTQLNATASVQGTFSYSPAAGTVLSVGNSQTLSVTFTPTDTANYNAATASVTVNVQKVNVQLSWSNPSAITYGAALSGTQLNATANVPGTFAYSPASGTVLNAGSQTLSVTFTPTDTANYSTATANVTITVNKATPTINWSNPADITYGTALSGTQLNASSSVAGSFAYSPASGTILNAGNGQTLSVSFTPTDTANYNTATANVTINVAKATPTISWSNPTAITYGTALGGAQLNATASVQGAFAYSPAAGTVPGAGSQTLSVTFTPNDTGNYNNATASVSLTVQKATPTISWSNPADISYGTALSGTQLNATASVPGTFAYSPAAGAVLNIGTAQTLSVTFTPTDTANYNTATASVTINVRQSAPSLTWANPASITYGTPLSGTQLNATANIPGSFAYSPASGMVLNAGSQTLSVTFTPTDTANYSTATANVTITVNKATPSINWSNPGDITYGVALSGTQLNASSGVAGSFAYSPASGTVLNAGNNQTLSVGFTPTDTANYNPATANVTINVLKATPTITWSNPSAITYGTALGSAQLNATAGVQGAFAYSPAAGTVPGAGNQTLSVTFTPSDTGNYNTTTASVTLTVQKATPTISWSNPADISYGTALSGTQLNATASVPGTFAYSPASGTVLNIGTAQTLSVTFTPTDTGNYNTATASATINVLRSTPSLSWPTPSPITYGTPLGPTQLNATANIPGSFAYSPAAGTVLSAGSQTLSVTFTPTDTANYTSSTTTATLNVQKATPTITWATPAPITYGTSLSGTQLNATASVGGAFAYSPAAGTVLSGGNQNLSVTFTPTDTANYNTATASVTINVQKVTPTVTWSNPSSITYGTPLSATQLNATANVPGAFAYSPPTGTVVNAGTQTLNVTFTPSDTTSYNTATASVSISVQKATPTITWSNPGPITYGTALGGSQLNATANTPGNFAYSPPAGTSLNAANGQTLSVNFTPSDTANYNSATASVTIDVQKATPSINWSAPSAITYGTPLSGTQLNAGSSVSGSFSYSPSSGTILSAGNTTLSVSFTPNDTANYNSASASVNLSVQKATPTINWSAPSAITHGTALSAAQLNATANVSGSFAYSPSAGTVLNAGAQTLSAGFTPNDTGNYNNATADVTLTVNKADQVITFAPLSDKRLGEPPFTLSATASSGLPVSFTVTGSAGISGNTVALTGPGEVRVTVSQPGDANHNPAPSVERQFKVIGNTPPTLAPIEAKTIDEGSPLSFVATASDSDVPPNKLTFSLESGAPAGAAIDPASGRFTWTPTEQQGPGTSVITVRVTDDGIPASLSATQSFSVTVREVNSAPVLGAISDQTVEAGKPLSVTISATDSDVPKNQIFFSLGPDAPPGMSIDPILGNLMWTPNATQGASIIGITVKVTDDGTPSLSAIASFKVVVNPSNSAPTLAAIPDQTIAEGSTLALNLTATDADRPAQTLQFNLEPGAPVGATVDPATGTITWTPTEAQGPSSNPVTVRVTDNGTPPLSATQTFTVTVNEVNTAPVLQALSNQTVDRRETLRLEARATDADLPANVLVFSLEPGAPAGASVDGSSGVFTWTPTDAQAGTTSEITLRVADNGTPPLSDTKTFTVIVRPAPNRPPTISTISNQSTPENTPTGAIAFTIADPDTPLANLKVAATSSNASLLPAGSISFQGEGANRTIALTPLPNVTGSAVITIEVDDGAGGKASATFEVTVTPVAPTITRQPQDVTVVAGAEIALSVTASGSQPLSYQWRKDGTPLSGATSASLQIANAQLEHAGQYSVEVTNRVASVTSSAATVTVTVALRITEQPVSQTVLAGANATFSVKAVGTGPLRYQWRVGNVDVPNATSATLTLNNVEPILAGAYSVVVSDTVGSVTSAVASLVVMTPVAITAQPQSQTVVEGANVTFAVEVTGTLPVRFQWQFNGVDLPGQTTAALQLNNVSLANAGQYSVAVNNVAGSAKSAPATLVVGKPPIITRQPQSQSVLNGTTVAFSVAVSGTEPLTYQWRRNGANLARATEPVLTLANVNPADVATYSVVVSNPAGSVTSGGADLTVVVGPRIDEGPQSQTRPAGATVTFTVNAAGTGPLNYQWRREGVDLPGETSTTLTLRNVQAANRGRYQVVVSNRAGPVVSSSAVLTVEIPPTILSQPQSQTVDRGVAVSFSVAATGTPPLSYQWQFNGTDVSGATASILVFNNVQPGQAGTYRVVVRNPAGEVPSADAVLRVIVPASILTHPASQSVQPGSRVTFSVGANGDAPLSYQWQKTGVNIAGATSSTLTIGSAQASDAGSYTVMVENPGGAVTSNPATLGLILPPISSGRTVQDAPPPIEAAEGTFDGGSNESGGGLLSRRSAPPRAGEERWFSWRAPANGIVTFSTVGSTFDTELAVFTGTPGNLTEVGSDDDRGGFFASEVKFNAAQATTYLVRVKGFGGAAGKIVVGFKLQTTAQRLPEISAHPQSRTVSLGQPVTLNVVATGNQLTYQWFANGVAIPGATNPTYTDGDVRESDAVKYTVKVTSDSQGPNPLTVETLPAIIQIGATDSIVVDKFKSAPRLGGQTQLQWLSREPGPQAGGSVARGYSGSQVFNTFGATKEQGEPNHAEIIGGASQWFTYVAPLNGVVRVSTEGSDFDTVLAIYTGPGTDFDSLKVEAFDNNSGADGQDSVAVTPVTAGTLYFIAVDGVKGATGLAKLSYQLAAAPAISTPPADRTVPSGSTVSFFVVATNALSSVTTNLPPLNYQWQKDGLRIPGETNRSLALLNVQPADAGDYAVVVSNYAGAVTSAVARLTVSVPLSITVPPQSQTVKLGDAVSFRAVVSGTRPIAYQWRLNGTDIPGAATDSYEISSVRAADVGNYTLVAQNAAGTVESQAATLSVSQAPVITAPPFDQLVTLGGQARFIVIATGSPPLNYQWRINGVNIAGATNATLEINNVGPAHVGEYTVEVNNPAGAVVSFPVAALAIRIPLTAVIEPPAQTVTAGSSAVFSARATGSGPLTYQWKKDGLNIAGATGPTFTRLNVQVSDAGQYTVVVTSGTESVESKPATLTVGATPVITQQPANQNVSPGANVTFGVTATGAEPLKYQWFRNGVAIAGATNATLVLNNVQTADAGSYSVSVSNSAGTVQSDLAVLTIRALVSDVRFDPVAGFQFRLNVPEGKRATIQVSADLANWVDFKPDQFTGTVDIQDPQSPGVAVRFYRIVVQ